MELNELVIAKTIMLIVILGLFSDIAYGVWSAAGMLGILILISFISIIWSIIVLDKNDEGDPIGSR